MKKKADAVFQGGGVRGMAFVGAVTEVMKDYEFVNLAGTSAGAIVAGLLAVGYTPAEVEYELTRLKYPRFKDQDWMDRLGAGGKALSVVTQFGIYEGNYFENWFHGLLEKKGKTEFGHVKTDDTREEYRYKVQMIASDLSAGKMLVLPTGLDDLGIDPDTFSIARAVRMSMSIPIFFEPVSLKDSNGRKHTILDGGVLSNYPVWLLDDGTSDPPWPTFGFKLLSSAARKLEAGQPRETGNIVAYLRAIWDTMFSAVDRHHISVSKGDYARTIGISTEVEVDGVKKDITTTDFDVTKAENEALRNNGTRAAEKFLKNWDFEDWKEKYRA